MESCQETHENTATRDELIELYRISREQILKYGELRWKRLTTYLTFTALFFAALAFALDRLGALICIVITVIGVLYTLCFLAIEVRAGRTLSGWVEESHRLERSLGGKNLHAKPTKVPSQQTSFRIMYGLFVLGWTAVGIVLVVQRYVYFALVFRILEQVVK